MKNETGEGRRLRSMVAGLVRLVDRLKPHMLQDWACGECLPHSDMLKAGFQCAYHQALSYMDPLHAVVSGEGQDGTRLCVFLGPQPYDDEAISMAHLVVLRGGMVIKNRSGPTGLVTLASVDSLTRRHREGASIGTLCRVAADAVGDAVAHVKRMPLGRRGHMPPEMLREIGPAAHVWVVVTGENCPGETTESIHASEAGAIGAAESLASGLVALSGYRREPAHPSPLRWEMDGDWVEVRRVEVQS